MLTALAHLSRYAFELNEIFTYDRVTEHFPGHLMHLYGHSPDAVSISRRGDDYSAFLLSSADTRSVLVFVGQVRLPSVFCSISVGSNDPLNSEWEFYPLNSWLDKKQDAVLFGDDEGSLFPLRTNVSRAIKAGGQTTIQRYSFTGMSSISKLMRRNLLILGQLPGRETSKKEKSGATKMDSPPTVYEIGSDVHLTHRARRESLARSMREAKICIVSRPA